MQGTTTELLLVLVLITLSAFFSATETAYSSLNRARLKSLADRGQKRAADTLALADRYDELLSTILVGNNIVNIALASVGAVMFVRWLGDSGVGVSTAVVTVFVLIFGEISPKSLAKEVPERFAMAVYPLIRVFVTVLKPVNWLFTKWKQFLSRLLRMDDDHAITQDELLTLVEEAKQEGGMNADESELLKSAIEFHDLDVSDILTPRVRVDGVPLESTPQETADRFEASGYSRLPVYEDTLDHIVGVVHQKDFYNRVRHGGDFSLSSIMKKPVYVPPGAKISDTLRLLQRTQSQMAVVADEYGGTVGIVTMEDILEELVGEIWDEHDEEETPITKIAADSYLVDAEMSFDDFADHFGLKADSDMASVSGWVMEQFGRLPDPGAAFDFQGLHVQITRAANHHIEQIRVTTGADHAAAAAERESDAHSAAPSV